MKDLSTNISWITSPQVWIAARPRNCSRISIELILNNIFLDIICDNLKEKSYIKTVTCKYVLEDLNASLPTVSSETDFCFYKKLRYELGLILKSICPDMKHYISEKKIFRDKRVVWKYILQNLGGNS
jgi:hypothetical protein